MQSWNGRGDDEIVTLWALCALIAPALPLAAPNPLYPAYAGTRPRVGGASHRSAVDRANSAAENPPDSRPFQSLALKTIKALLENRSGLRARGC
jgi:hypothetical protein